MKFLTLLVFVVGLLAAAPVQAAPFAPAITAGPCSSASPSDNVLVDPPTVESYRGRLNVTLYVRQDTTQPKNAPERMCYTWVDARTGKLVKTAPTLRAHPGDEIEVTLVNDLPAALVPMSFSTGGMPMAMPTRAPRVPGEDHPITHFTNLHFHGLNVSPMLPSDNVLRVMLPPARGASFSYRLHIPQNEPSGLYWYHSHIHGESKEQVKAGLTGLIYIDAEGGSPQLHERFILVRGGDEDFSTGQMVHRVPRIRATHGGPTLESTKLLPTESNGKLIPFPFAPPAECPQNAGTRVPDAEFLNVNGIPVPETRSGRFPTAYINEGRTEVWHVANTAAISYLNLQLIRNGRAMSVRVVGRDGIPVRDEAGMGGVMLSHVVLPPAGRADIVIPPLHAGDTQALYTAYYDTGCAGDQDGTRKLVDMVVVPQTHAVAIPNEAETAFHFNLKRNARFAGLRSAPINVFRQFVLTEYPLADGSRTDFYITDLSDPRAHEVPFSMDAPPSVIVKSGSVEEWIIQNYTQEVHAFHIHQIHFLVQGGVPIEEGLGQLLDTVNVPSGHYAVRGGQRTFIPGAVRLKMDFRDPTIIGEFVYHCHILEHEDNGMMAKIRVIP